MLTYTRQYVALEKNRTGKRVDLPVDLPEGIPETTQIVPFILIPFVENAFKHGVQRTARKSWVHQDDKTEVVKRYQTSKK